jgi:hypothetical protein
MPLSFKLLMFSHRAGTFLQVIVETPSSSLMSYCRLKLFFLVGATDAKNCSKVISLIPSVPNGAIIFDTIASECSLPN